MSKADMDLIGSVRPDFVPASDYISPEFARLEFEHGVWTRTWQMAGRVEDLAGVGDFVTHELGRESVIVLRSAPDHIVAYHNVCQHRGRRLKNRGEPSGNTGSRLYCRYHGWCWDLEGRLVHVPTREDWQGCRDFGDEDLALSRVKVDTWGGWLWISMDPDAEPLAQYLAPVPEYLDCFRFEDMRTVWSQTIRVPANWKTVLEGFSEAYHAPTTHPQTNVFDDGFGVGPSTTVAHGLHGQMILGLPLARPVKPPIADYREFYNRFMTTIAAQYHAMYFEPSLTASKRVMAELPADASLIDVAVAHFKFNREAAEALGMVWPETLTMENVARAGFDWHVFPNTIILHTVDGVVTYRTRPDGFDPDHCFWDLRCLKRVPPGTTTEYQHEYFPTPESYRGKNLLMEQDLQNIVEVQPGMHSSGFRGARTNPRQECGTVTNLHKALHDFIRESMERRR